MKLSAKDTGYATVFNSLKNNNWNSNKNLHNC